MKFFFFPGWLTQTEGAQLLSMALWGTLALALFAVLIFLLATRRGRSEPMRICIVLSLLVHVMLAGYASSVQIIQNRGPGGDAESFEIVIVDSDDTYQREEPLADEQPPWERLASGEITRPEIAEPERLAPDANQQIARAVPSDIPSLIEPAAVPLSGSAPEMILPKAAAFDVPQIRRGESLEAPQQIEAPAPEKTVDAPTVGPVGDEPSRTPLADQVAVAPKFDGPTNTISEVPLAPTPSFDLPRMSLPEAQLDQAAMAIARPTVAAPAQALAEEVESTAAGETLTAANGGIDEGGENIAAAASELVAISRADIGGGSLPRIEHELPSIYKLRVAPDREEAAVEHGGSRETEAAVEAGLAWLARHQSEDGRWDVSRLEGGRGFDPQGRDRSDAGANADMGITALAVLAFNGAGYTHQEGKYQQTVARALSFLIASQRSDGFLGGEAELFARMYCHGMATFAISEAYAMTGDEALRPAVEKAVRYTLRAQNPRTGGWRYRPGDDGDMSQHGWQVMALKSAELAGIEVTDASKRGSLRYVASVSSGRQGELAAYRPGQLPSRTMTAEALVCRQFLAADADRIGAEAAGYINQVRPGAGKPNLYYWYYATIGLYRMQGDAWEQWNHSLQRELISTQVQTGQAAGSWSADTVWGGYGGRAYSTAMATLCLEVYYRFLPLYAETARPNELRR